MNKEKYNKIKCPICNGNILSRKLHEDYNCYLDDTIEVSTVFCNSCHSNIKIIRYNGIEFCCLSNDVIKLINQSKNTKIKYVLRCSITNVTTYYDVICIYNEEENWIKNIPVPIFVKLFAPYLNNKKIEDKLKTLKKLEEDICDRNEINFWGNELSFENIEFLRLFIINTINNYKYNSLDEISDDINIKECFITDDEWKNLKFEFKEDILTLQVTTFKPVLDKLGFEFYDKNNINNYHHGIYSMLSCEVFKDDDYGYRYSWCPTISDIENGYADNPDDYRQEPRWGFDGCYAFNCEYANYEQLEEGCSSDFDDLLDYLYNLFLCLNPSTLEKNYRNKINSNFPNKNVTIDIYVDVYSNKIRWYKKKKIEWNQKIFDSIQKTFEECNEKYEKILEEKQLF